MSLKFKIANNFFFVNIMYIKGIVHLQLPVPIDLQSVFLLLFFYHTMEANGDQQLKVNNPFKCITFIEIP